MNGAAAVLEPVDIAATAPAAACYHCGEPLPAQGRWSVTIAGLERAMCCAGCEAVARTIVDIGQENYYRERSAPAANAAQSTLVPPALRLLDDDLARYARPDGGHELTLAVEGIRCAACVWLIERRLLQLPGVLEAAMNVSSERLLVRWDAARSSPAAIVRALRGIGYVASPYDAGREGGRLRQAGRTLGRQLFVAGLSMMQVMMYALPAYVAADDGTLDPAMAALMRWAGLFLTLPAVCYSAQPFFKGALASLRVRAAGMDVPVALGIAAAFGASCVATFRGAGAVYFDSVTMFIFLLLCSRYLELTARRKAAAVLERLQHGLPEAATRLAGFPASRAAETVAAATLQAGDVILVRRGEAVAADAVVVEGGGAFDLSLLSGESAPRHRQEGDSVPGGALNAGDAVLLRVVRPASASTLSDLLKLVERAGAQKPAIALWADRVAARFVLALLLLALGSFVYWSWADAARAWPIAIAVLVVSCPCALSLATPSALAAATDRLLQQGVLVLRPHVLETLQRATHIVFDKTGTLTMGAPALLRLDALGAMPGSDCLRIAAALEAVSAHPLARAIAAAGNADTAHASGAVDTREIPGQGLEGTIAGRRYRIGSATFVAGIAGVAAPPGAPAEKARQGSAVYLGGEDGWLARLLLADAPRPEAGQVVEHFRAAGKALVLLSGDEDAITQAVAKNLGIAEAHGACLPQQKLAYVQALQARGAVVAMIGDGINDAAVLKAADVSFAMGGGAALAQAQADAVLMSGRLSSLTDAARMAARTLRVIRQNLAWATLYNLLAIPAAATGHLNPWLSGAGMAASSALVIGNALRLRRAAPRTQ